MAPTIGDYIIFFNRLFFLSCTVTGDIETEEQLEATLTGLRGRCAELIGAGKKVLVQ
jgi:hypothetical protein